jgi:hypothetical protein
MSNDTPQASLQLPSYIEAIIAQESLPSALSGSSILNTRLPTVEEIMTMVDASGNANTQKAYRGYMSEFITWCEKQSHYSPATRMLVTEGKMIVFLETQVVGRKSKLQRKSGSGSSIISASTVKQYISAITKLFNIQKRAYVNGLTALRTSTLKDYISYVSRQEHQRTRDDMVCRALNTITDGYHSMDTFVRFAKGFLDLLPDILHRDRLSFLLCHYGLWRSESSRMLEFGDLDLVTSTSHSGRTTEMLVTRLHQGTT